VTSFLRQLPLEVCLSRETPPFPERNPTQQIALFSYSSGEISARTLAPSLARPSHPSATGLPPRRKTPRQKCEKDGFKDRRALKVYSRAPHACCVIPREGAAAEQSFSLLLVPVSLPDFRCPSWSVSPPRSFRGSQAGAVLRRRHVFWFPRGISFPQPNLLLLLSSASPAWPFLQDAGKKI